MINFTHLRIHVLNLSDIIVTTWNNNCINYIVCINYLMQSYVSNECSNIGKSHVLKYVLWQPYRICENNYIVDDQWTRLLIIFISTSWCKFANIKFPINRNINSLWKQCVSCCGQILFFWNFWFIIVHMCIENNIENVI